MIKGKTAEQIRQMFRIAYDFTPEEEESRRKNFSAFGIFFFFFLVYYYYGILLSCFTVLIHDKKFEVTYMNINIHTYIHIYIYTHVCRFYGFHNFLLKF